MRAGQILLISLALMVLSSHHGPAKVSAAKVTGTGCQSFILNPVAPCDPAKCRQDCDEKVKGGVGTCYGHPFHKGCDCDQGRTYTQGHQGHGPGRGGGAQASRYCSRHCSNYCSYSERRWPGAQSSSGAATDCEYCPPVASSSSTLARKLTQMN